MAPRKAGGNTFVHTSMHGTIERMVRTENGKYVAEHRLVFERHWKVKLRRWHRVMHINGDTLDNRIENLTLGEYAMELLRQGKSIEQVGKTICSKGHPRNVPQKDGATIRYVCRICTRDSLRETRKRQQQKRST